MTTNDDNFDYGVLGKDFWMDAMETTKATLTQAKFACARHSGATRTKAAELAGYSASDPQGLRVAGSRADDTKAVQDMLVMASAAAVSTTDAPYTVAEARQKIGRMVKTSLDPSTVIKGTELLARLDQVDRDRGQTPDDDGLNPWRVERNYLVQDNGAVAYVLMFIDRDLMGNIANLNLLHDTHALMMHQRFGPELWHVCCNRLNDSARKDLDRKLADKKYQLEVRKKVWAEIGVVLDDRGLFRMAGAA